MEKIHIHLKILENIGIEYKNIDREYKNLKNTENNKYWIDH